ncbi:MAG: 1,4-dihydroxy-2-naphthoate octaprenyltransferase [Verrucomicrobiota bacterium]
MLLASRPKTLPAAVAPVVAGSALAWRTGGEFSWLLAWCTLLSTIAIQIATNYFNDAVDARKGADTDARLGPLRATAAGLISPRGMLTAGVVMLAVAVLISLPMVAARGWPVVAIGVVSLFFTYGYTGGPVPLAYRGLGDLFVLLFFGLIAVSGTVFVQTGEWRREALLLGAQIGMLSTVLIAINNLRDREEDSRSSKRTLAVRFGVRFAKVEIAILCLGPYVLGWFWSGFGLPLAGMWTLGAAWIGAGVAVMVGKTPPGRIYNKFLALSAAHLMLWTLLFTAAMLLWAC